MQLKSGETIEFTSYKFKGYEIRINVKNGKDVVLEPYQVIGYYDVKEGEQFILKYGETDYMENNPYYFDKLILEGVINVYERKHIKFSPAPTKVTQIGGASVGVSTNKITTELFLEKKFIYRSATKNIKGKNDKQSKFSSLKSFVSDNHILVKQIEAEDFKGDNDDILKVIKSYNLEKFKKVEDSNPNATVVFYLKAHAKHADSIRFKINDNLITDFIVKRNYPAVLSSIDFNKVCLNNHCELIKGSPYYIKYYEILVSEKEISFVQKKPSDANLYNLNKTNK